MALPMLTFRASRVRPLLTPVAATGTTLRRRRLDVRLLLRYPELAAAVVAGSNRLGAAALSIAAVATAANANLST